MLFGAAARDTPALPHVVNSRKLERNYHRNQQYSITAVTDASGAVIERYAYTAYGTPTITDASSTTRSTTAIGNRYTYTGRERDEALALYHYRARMYDPVGGRFVGLDPIRFLGGFSHFAYVRNLPTTRYDPLGLYDIGIFIDGAGQYFDPTSIYHLYENYKGDISIYYPTWISASKFNEQVDKLVDRICKAACEHAANTDINNPEPFNIDMVGWSRGACVAMAVAEKLRSNGCTCTFTRKCGFGEKTESFPLFPVPIRFLGVIDPVSTGLPWGGTPSDIPSNVQCGYWAVATGTTTIGGLPFWPGQVTPPKGGSGNPGVTIIQYPFTHQTSGFEDEIEEDMHCVGTGCGTKW